jgi:DNA-binding MarR family transcriptional regulator
MTLREEGTKGERKQQESVQLVDQIIQLSTRMMQQQEEKDRERFLLLREVKGEAFVDVLQSLTITALHVLEMIGQHEPVKGIHIARQLAITKGAVSKITRKLLDQQLILASQVPENKKDIYFRLTERGREVVQWHQGFHEEAENQARQFLGRYTLEELRLIVRFLHNYIGEG